MPNPGTLKRQAARLSSPGFGQIADRVLRTVLSRFWQAIQRAIGGYEVALAAGPAVGDYRPFYVQVTTRDGQPVEGEYYCYLWLADEPSGGLTASAADENLAVDKGQSVNSGTQGLVFVTDTDGAAVVKAKYSGTAAPYVRSLAMGKVATTLVHATEIP